MLLYSISHPGAPVQAVPSHSSTLILGERGRGRWEVRLNIRGNGDFVDFRRYSDSKRPYLVRQGTARNPSQCLIAINATGGYKRGISYYIRSASGLEILERGKCAFGDAGRVGHGEHVLALASDGAEFCLRNSRGTIFSYLFKDGVWTLESEEERNTRYALGALIKGNTAFKDGIFTPITLDRNGKHEGIENVSSFISTWASSCRVLPEQDFTLTGDALEGPVFVAKAIVPSSRDWDEAEQYSKRSFTADPFENNWIVLPAKGQVPERELVLVKEYVAGRRVPKKPSFLVDMSHVEILGRAEAFPGRGTERWTLVSAPLGWAASKAH